MNNILSALKIGTNFRYISVYRNGLGQFWPIADDIHNILAIIRPVHNHMKIILISQRNWI